MFALVASAMILGTQQSTQAALPASIYDFTVTDIDGKQIPLKRYKGKVMLIVNVASKCGNTPQYAALEQLYKTKRKDGLVVLGFPANNFGQQEPGTNSEIKEFCSATYQVNFPMFSKISVKGDDTAPLYQWLIAHADRHNDIEWNFAKFVVDRNGNVVARIAPGTKPDTPEVEDAIAAALKG